ncbi:response regulator transcription factor [Clostridium oryzae]|uniref:Stage 0 sporulation protein A homolog n=1 Tax=Clostridium oryzae TaxID=1450648 RepID=A0A1V4IVD3_9CLOT|nr:response regulator [Clostridium oryzae]OPJ63991.1 putative response regulatory protein [Clostridium oryzae]
MYSLLIIDDEILELDTLKDYVDWDSYDISVIGTAKNGKNALSIAIEHKPDIIITDIKMPIMDGVEFSRRLREANIYSKLIFLTGYDDFAYAKNAIDVQASGYILKPFSIAELDEVINQVREQLESDRLRLNSVKLFVKEIFELLLDNPEIDDVKNVISELDKIKSYDYNDSNYKMMLVYSDNDAVNHVKDYIYSLDEYAQIIIKDTKYVAVILNSNISQLQDMEKFARAVQSEIFMKEKKYAAVIYLDSAIKLEELGRVYKKLITLEECIFYSGKNCIINASIFCHYPANNIEIPNFENKLIKAFFTYKRESISQVIDEYFNFMIDNKISKSMFLESLFNLFLYVWENFFKNNPNIDWEPISRTELWNELIKFKDINDAYSFTEQNINRLTQYLIEKQKDKNQQVVDKVIKFIEKNFGNQIIINDVAKDIYLSPNYIRNIFKEKTGTTFLEYLVDFRMKKASEFLKDKSLKVHEVSNKVGYENVSYFCSVFARHYGVSPSEYRNKF